MLRPKLGFRPGHSTESAILCVLSDILLAVDRGDFAALVLLDLSAAFDTVDHDICHPVYSVSNRSLGSPTSQGTGSGRISRAKGNLSVAEAYGRLLFP